MHVFFRVLPYVRRYPLLAFATLGCAVLGTLMVVIFPAVTQRIVDDVIRGNQPGLLAPLLARRHHPHRSPPSLAPACLESCPIHTPHPMT